MKRAYIYIIVILLIPFLIDAKGNFVYAGPAAAIEKKAEDIDQEGSNKPEVVRKLLYEKLSKRTKEWRDLLDDLFFTVNSYARKAIAAKDYKSEKDFIAVLSDYNSVLGDLGLMQVILDLGKFVEEKRFDEYFGLIENGFERLKDSFSLKNELFLNRIDQLKNKDALRYEKKLLRNYKDYFEYDLQLDKIGVKEDAPKLKK
jgi:hypothetical protein